MIYQDSDLSTQHIVLGLEDPIVDSILGHQNSTLGTLIPVLAHQDSIHGTLNSVTGYHDSILGTQNQFRVTGHNSWHSDSASIPCITHGMEAGQTISNLKVPCVSRGHDGSSSRRRCTPIYIGPGGGRR